VHGQNSLRFSIIFLFIGSAKANIHMQLNRAPEIGKKRIQIFGATYWIRIGTDLRYRFDKRSIRHEKTSFF
jgi:hypothetical protein